MTGDEIRATVIGGPFSRSRKKVAKCLQDMCHSFSPIGPGLRGSGHPSPPAPGGALQGQSEYSSCAPHWYLYFEGVWPVLEGKLWTNPDESGDKLERR